MAAHEPVNDDWKTATEEPVEKKKSIFSKKSAPESTENSKKPKEKNPENRLVILFTIIIVLLFLQLAVSGFQLYRDFSAEAAANARQAQINKSVATYTANLDALTTQLLSDYKANVYNNKSVDTTSKQQVMGLEFNFNAIMLLVKQNSRLMELIALSK